MVDIGLLDAWLNTKSTKHGARQLRSPLLTHVRKFDESSFSMVVCLLFDWNLDMRGDIFVTSDRIMFFVRVKREINGCILFLG